MVVLRFHQRVRIAIDQNAVFADPDLRMKHFFIGPANAGFFRWEKISGEIRFVRQLLFDGFYVKQLLSTG
jgi:hypothetical protein